MVHLHRQALPLLIVLALLRPVPAAADAILYEQQLVVADFGDLSMEGDGYAPVGCGPVSAVNSMKYLQKTHTIYGNGLITPNTRDGMKQAADKLIESDYMDTTADCGTYPETFINGKRKYMEEKKPGKTSYRAQMSEPWQTSRGPKPAFVSDKTKPTWQFIHEALQRKHDVEILLRKNANTAHYVTVTSFHFEDRKDKDGKANGKIDGPDFDNNWQGETAWIDFVDPQDGRHYQKDLIQNFDDSIAMKYKNPSSQQDPESYWDIEMAVSQGPIPEPASLALLGLGGLAIVHRRG